MSENEPPVPPSFGGDEQVLVQRLREMFVQQGQSRRIALGQTPAERAVFRKLHGVARGVFEPLAELPPNLRVGLLGHGALTAWVRFSSDASPTDPDLGTTVGMAVKLFGVPGSGLGADESQTADLLMQNYPVFFVDDLREMVDFTYAGVVQGDYPAYLRTHATTRRILDEMAATIESSVLTASYWGLLPFRLGDEVVKYRFTSDAPPMDVPDDATDYLAIDLAQRLSAGEATLTLSVQRRTDPGRMPLDEATVEWPGGEESWLPVARLTLPRQDVTARGQADYGQSLAFNIWRAPEVNRPVPESSIAAARRLVYAAGADVRHEANGQSLDDPPTARSEKLAPAPADQTIVKAVIHPPIGVARVGNSSDDFFIGPEVNEPEPLPPGSYRDEQGRLKRQAARFRIYGVNALGEIVRELSDPAQTPEGSDVQIRWHVELANTKAAWFGFQLALDIPEASSAPPTTLRNATVADRASLAITPAPRAIDGVPDAAPVAFDDGRFMGEPVYLGELRTDDAGRLVVLGGRGVSASHDGSRAITFANNEGWHDDVSDGPVRAQVVLDGVRLQVVDSWVVVAPPNYAPQRKSVRTMWDVMRDVAITAGALAAPTAPSFSDDIAPLFTRLNGLQWVNAGFAAGFGHGGVFDLTSPAAMARLASDSPAHREMRRVVAGSFRDDDVDGQSPKPWPWLYGDAMNIPPVASPRQNSTLTTTQQQMLQQWAEGAFVCDHDPSVRPPRTLDEVPLADQGDVLTRAAMEFCLADAFHPGCEMTWPVRTWSMYASPFRIAHAESSTPAPALGGELTGDVLTGLDGPLGPQRAGDLTRWMAVPWQTDTASCRSGYDPTYDPYVPTFWPARVPNQVLTAENYALVMDEENGAEKRRLAFANRAAWIEPLGSADYVHQINNMVAGFDHLGIVEARPGPTDGLFPAVLEVEDQHRHITEHAPGQGGDASNESRPSHETSVSAPADAVGVHGSRRRSAAEVDVSQIDKVRRFPDGLRS